MRVTAERRAEHHCSIFNLYPGQPGQPAIVSDRDQVFTTREILNLHSNIQSRSVKHFFSVSTQKSCQFVFRRSAEFYFTQQIKCQSLPDSGIDTAVYSLAGLHWIHELLQSSQHFAAFQAAVFIFSLSRGQS